MIDPRESWGEMIKRVAEFKPPPLVERDELPEEYKKPTVLQKARTLMNNSEITRYKKKRKRNDEGEVEPGANSDRVYRSEMKKDILNDLNDRNAQSEAYEHHEMSSEIIELSHQSRNREEDGFSPKEQAFRFEEGSSDEENVEARSVNLSDEEKPAEVKEESLVKNEKINREEKEDEEVVDYGDDDEEEVE